jgi:feruloyl-CoA synthase
LPVGPDTIAAVFFTSGSTGAPKGVITTHRMISANQAAIATLWPLLAHEPPRLLDWLPWHHTFGGNDNFNKMIWHGGTLYIDDGRPTADAIGRTVANIKVVLPTIHINVPRGLDLLLDAMQSDPLAREALLCKLRLIFFAGAGLSRATWKRLQSLVDGHAAAGGQRIALTSGWGSTECGSTICLVHFSIDSPNVVGLPLPGYELKLVPVGPKLEARVRGPNVTPGYWPPGHSDASVFDEEGYFRTGDAARLLDVDQPEKGLVFDGRVAEDFKLSTGTWVSVGPLRLSLLAALAPYVRDVAIAGQDEPFVAVLVFIDVDACLLACGLPAQTPTSEVMASMAVRAKICHEIGNHNAAQPASSTAVRRLVLIGEPPSADVGEINDKGHLNQRMALARREALVRCLFDEVASADILIC